MTSKTLKAICKRIVLTDASAVFKTERFSEEVKELVGVDEFLSKLTDAVILNGVPARGSYRISVSSHAFFFLSSEGNLIFFGYRSSEKALRLNDRRIALFVGQHPEFNFEFAPSELQPAESDLKKLYRLSEAYGVNYPLLTPAQRAVVEAEDRSVIVQGVAGSGKTNLCIDKALYTASRNYRGKTLYTTFSRGLLIETRKKLDVVRNNILKLLAANKEGNVVVIGEDIARALEFKLGVYLMNSVNWLKTLEIIADYIENKVECLLPEDLYRRRFGDAFVAGEDYFVKVFIPNSGMVEGLFKRLSGIGAEVVYKEIYGYLFGRNRPFPTEAQYAAERAPSLTAQEAEAIYRIAREYRAFLVRNSLVDNPLIAERLLPASEEEYSLAIVDEVQDFTEKELALIKKMSLKLFAVGDALQMINPSYFSFSSLKTLVGGMSRLGELKSNYRSTKKIAELTERLGELNMSLFGTHNFILRSRTVDSDVDTTAVYLRGGNLLERLKAAHLDGYTVICGDLKRKRELQKTLPRREILTVSEAKGLERDVVVLYDVLTDFHEKWAELGRLKIDRKRADENSVYRYYFNLFYVGVTRAKRHLLVYEEKEIPLFKPFFMSEFSPSDLSSAVRRLEKLLIRVETDDSELARRCREFIRLGQYDNALSAADSLLDDGLRRSLTEEVSVYRDFVRKGDYRGAGIAFWRGGLHDKAREMFSLSRDRSLIELMDASLGRGEGKLDYTAVNYFTEVDDPVARELISETLKNDLAELKAADKKIAAAIGRIRSRNG